MNKFFSLWSIVLFYCGTIAAQSIIIDYNNPLWSFDYMLSLIHISEPTRP